MNCPTVATECPSCGAPLDFAEGTNSLKCLHCLSNLFVTGRKQVLSYLVAPKLDEKLASALAIKGQRDRGRSASRRVKSQLYFIPYYRMTGQDLTWEEAEKKVDSDGDAELRSILLPESREDFRRKTGFDLLITAGELLIKLADKIFYGSDEPETKSSLPDPHTGQFEQTERSAGYSRSIRIETKESHCQKNGQYLNGDLALHDRYVEKNFIACKLQGRGLYSLGIRPSVLRLQLFSREALDANAKAVGPSLSPKDAEAVGIRTGLDQARISRQVIGRVLSIVYFPFWVVATDCKGKKSISIIDAVTKAVIEADAPEDIYNVLDREIKEDPEVAGFRPLVCPNCGWDLPVRPEDCIFFCSSCNKAWQIHGSLLKEVSFLVAGVEGMDKSRATQYLPFWIFRAGDREGRPFYIFAPAFRYRRLKILMDLALTLTRLQPTYDASGQKNNELTGCYYDSEDGLLLAGLARSVLTAKDINGFREACSKELSPSEASLTWFPFRIEGNYLAAPFCIMSIPKNLLF
jgi:DNA-directed RNA polymerase subunit RPC12/RpoP